LSVGDLRRFGGPLYYYPKERAQEGFRGGGKTKDLQEELPEASRIRVCRKVLNAEKDSKRPFGS